MSSTHEDREAKETWLIRPIRWAGETATIVGATCLLMMSDQSVSWDTIAIVATGGLIVAGALSLWGMRRILNVTRRSQ
jgi:hypothetical protein